MRGGIVLALENFKEDAAVVSHLQIVAREDSSYRARGAALRTLGRIKSTGTYETLAAAVNADSPDGPEGAALRRLIQLVSGELPPGRLISRLGKRDP